MTRSKTTVKESSIEKAFLRQMRKHGVLTRKMNGEGFRAWPDRLIVLYKQHLYIEFKRPGGEATEAQQDIHDRLRALGHRVKVYDDATAATEFVLKVKSRIEESCRE